MYKSHKDLRRCDDGSIQNVWSFCQLQSPLFCCFKAPLTPPKTHLFFFWKNDTWKMMHFFSKCSLSLGTNSFIFRGGNKLRTLELEPWPSQTTHDLDEILQVHSSLIWWKSHPIRLLDIGISVVLEGQHTSAYIYILYLYLYIHVYIPARSKGCHTGCHFNPKDDELVPPFGNHERRPFQGPGIRYT